MTRQKERSRFPEIGDGSGLGPPDAFYREEVALALRNRGMPLEGLRYPEIGSALGISASAVSEFLRRAIARLRKGAL